MNNLRAGSVLKVPDEQQVRASTPLSHGAKSPSRARTSRAIEADLRRAPPKRHPRRRRGRPGQGDHAGARWQRAAPAGDRLKIASDPWCESRRRSGRPRSPAQGSAGPRCRTGAHQPAVAESARTAEQGRRAGAGGGRRQAGPPRRRDAGSRAGRCACPGSGSAVGRCAGSGGCPARTAGTRRAPKAEAPKAAPPAEEPGMLSGLLGSNLPLVADSAWFWPDSSATACTAVASRPAKTTSTLAPRPPRQLAVRADRRPQRRHRRRQFLQLELRPAATQVDASDVDPVAEATSISPTAARSRPRTSSRKRCASSRTATRPA